MGPNPPYAKQLEEDIQKKTEENEEKKKQFFDRKQALSDVVPGTLTFQTANGAETVPIGANMDSSLSPKSVSQASEIGQIGNLKNRNNNNNGQKAELGASARMGVGQGPAIMETLGEDTHAEEEIKIKTSMDGDELEEKMSEANNEDQPKSKRNKNMENQDLIEKILKISKKLYKNSFKKEEENGDDEEDSDNEAKLSKISSILTKVLKFNEGKGQIPKLDIAGSSASSAVSSARKNNNNNNNSNPSSARKDNAIQSKEKLTLSEKEELLRLQGIERFASDLQKINKTMKARLLEYQISNKHNLNTNSNLNDFAYLDLSNLNSKESNPQNPNLILNDFFLEEKNQKTLENQLKETKGYVNFLKLSLEQKTERINELETQLSDALSIAGNLKTGFSSDMEETTRKSQLLKEMIKKQLSLESHLKTTIFEYKRREKSRALEFSAGQESVCRLEQQNKKLQSIINRQANDLHTIMAQREKKFSILNSKILEFSEGPHFVNGTMPETEKTKKQKAAEFLVQQAKELLTENDQLQLRLVEISKNLQFLQLENSDLKISLNNFKDKEEGNGTLQNLVVINRQLQDKLKQLQVECSAERVIALDYACFHLEKDNWAKDNVINELKKELYKLYSSSISNSDSNSKTSVSSRSSIEKEKEKQLEFNNKVCIAHLERLLQKHEQAFQQLSKKVEQEVSTPSKMLNNLKNVANLQPVPNVSSSIFSKEDLDKKSSALDAKLNKFKDIFASDKENDLKPENEENENKETFLEAEHEIHVSQNLDENEEDKAEEEANPEKPEANDEEDAEKTDEEQEKKAENESDKEVPENEGK